MTVSERIRARLETMGVTQSQLRAVLASHHGVEVTRQAISGWCRGQRPDLCHLDAVMDALVVPVGQRREWVDQWLSEERARSAQVSS